MAVVSATQAPSDPVLAIGSSSTRKDDAATGDDFAAALNGAVTAGKETATGDAPDGTVAVLTLPIPAPKAGEDDDSTKNDGLAALFAALPVALDPTAPITGAGEGTDAVAGVEAPATQGGTLESIAAFLEQAATEADEADAPAGAETDELNAVLDVDGAAPDGATSAPVASSSKSTPAVEGADAPAFTITIATDAATDGPEKPETHSKADPSAEVNVDAGQAEAATVADAPPDAPPDKAPQATVSVVRPVGNAPQKNTDASTVVKPVGLDTAAAVATGTKDDSKVSDSINQPVANQASPAAAQSQPAPATVPAQQSPVTQQPVQMQGQPLPQVADAIVDRLNNDGGEARVILDPPGMGEIVIKLHATGGHVHVEVIAQRADALQVLRDGSPSLQTLLQDRGLDMGMAQFTLSQQGQGGQQQAPDQSPKNTGNGFAQLMGIDEPDATNRNFNLLRAAYNPDGAHLYRV